MLVLSRSAFAPGIGIEALEDLEALQLRLEA